MSKRYLQWGYDSFKDTKTGEISDNHIHILNQQAERIAELEEQLKGCIIPKFKIGQIVWFIDTRVNDFNAQRYIIQYFKIEAIRFDNFDFEYEDCWGDIIVQKDLFATKEEAQAKLEELQGE